MGTLTPESASSGTVPLSQTSYSMQPSPLSSTTISNPGMNNPSFLEFSAMMFPSGDPFAYPNQHPMTTIEDKHNYPLDPSSQQQVPASALHSPQSANSMFPAGQSPLSSMPNANANAAPAGGYDNGLEVQLYGPMQPFWMPQEMAHRPNANDEPDMGVGAAIGNGNMGSGDNGYDGMGGGNSGIDMMAGWNVGPAPGPSHAADQGQGAGSYDWGEQWRAWGGGAGDYGG